MRVKDHSIHDVLNLTLDQATVFFSTSCPKVLKGLRVLQQLGLGYLTLGQRARFPEAKANRLKSPKN